MLGKLRTLQLAVYLPEDNYGHVKLGQGAHVRVDSYPGVVFTGTVTHVADQAEFALRSVQTVEGRRAKVYAIELEVANPDGKLKPGMPADVTFEYLNRSVLLCPPHDRKLLRCRDVEYFIWSK